MQIKCELRLLSQFAFNLNPDWELPVVPRVTAASRKVAAAIAVAAKTAGIPDKPLKEGVRDMLVKHHLFSWDL